MKTNDLAEILEAELLDEIAPKRLSAVCKKAARAVTKALKDEETPAAKPVELTPQEALKVIAKALGTTAPRTTKKAGGGAKKAPAKKAKASKTSKTAASKPAAKPKAEAKSKSKAPPRKGKRNLTPEARELMASKKTLQHAITRKVKKAEPHDGDVELIAEWAERDPELVKRYTASAKKRVAKDADKPAEKAKKPAAKNKSKAAAKAKAVPPETKAPAAEEKPEPPPASTPANGASKELTNRQLDVLGL